MSTQENKNRIFIPSHPYIWEQSGMIEKAKQPGLPILLCIRGILDTPLELPFLSACREQDIPVVRRSTTIPVPKNQKEFKQTVAPVLFTEYTQRLLGITKHHDEYTGIQRIHAINVIDDARDHEYPFIIVPAEEQEQSGITMLAEKTLNPVLMCQMLQKDNPKQHVTPSSLVSANLLIHCKEETITKIPDVLITIFSPKKPVLFHNTTHLF